MTAGFAISVTAGAIALAVTPPGGPTAPSALHGIFDAIAYIAGTLGIVSFVRSVSRGDPDNWLDAATVGFCTSLVLLEFVIDPNGTLAPNPGPDSVGLVLTVIVDAIVLTTLARFVVRPLASRPISFFGALVGAVVLADAVYYGSATGAGVPRFIYEAAWYAAYGAWAAAVVHPDFTAISRGRTIVADDSIRTDRIMTALAVHMGCLGISLAVFLWHLLGDLGPTGVLFLLGIAVQLVLASLRGARLIRHLEESVARRLHAEEELRRSDARFAELARVAPVGIFIAGPDGRSSFQNDAWGRIAGVDAATGLGSGYLGPIHPDDRATALAAWETAVAAGAPMAVEHRYHWPDGTVRWVQSAAVPLRGADGAVDGFVGTVADVTDFVVARRAAEEREAFVGALITQAPVGISLYGQDGHLLRTNDAERRIRHLAGVDTDAVDLHADPVLVALGQGDAIRDVLAGRATNPDLPAIRIARPRSRDDAGAEGGEAAAWVRIRWFPLRDAAGDVIAVISFTEDVTAAVHAAAEQARVEGRLREAAKLEALGVLAGGIAHDFNNLLVAIVGHAELARSEVADGSMAAQDMKSVVVAAERAADLARQMLAYSGRGSIVVGPVHLGALIREIGDLLARSIAKGAHLRYEFTPDLPPVIADATQIRQLVLNLIVNASDALSGRPGTIAVRTRWATLAADDPHLVPGTDATPGRYIALEVADTGHGMDAATVVRIFDPFFSTKAAGRGLGLAATIGIVKGHGGAIRLESKPGLGTRFEVLLQPAAGEAAAAARGEPHRDSHAAGLRRGQRGEEPVRTVLLVDDEPTVRLIGRRILERSGFRVIEATDGLLAVELFEADPGAVDVVLLDLTLPAMDGTQVLDRLRLVRPDLPVVICSGWAAEEVGDRLATDHRTQFVQKPYQSEALLEALFEVLHPDGI